MCENYLNGCKHTSAKLNGQDHSLRLFEITPLKKRDSKGIKSLYRGASAPAE